MNTFLLVRLAETAANCGLGMALMTGGALVARRSVAAGTWFAIAGFCEVGSELVLRTLGNPAVFRFGFASLGDLFELFQVFKVCGVLGALMLAVRALPARTA